MASHPPTRHHPDLPQWLQLNRPLNLQTAIVSGANRLPESHNNLRPLSFESASGKWEMGNVKGMDATIALYDGWVPGEEAGSSRNEEHRPVHRRIRMSSHPSHIGKLKATKR